MKKAVKKLWTILLALAMTVSMLPALAAPTFAEGAAAEPITVYLTVSNQGALAKANDESLMALKPVTVTDIDENGKFTFDEALVAAHKAYNSEDGYNPGSGFVKKLWGVETTNTLFFVNSVGLSNGVTVDTVADGDYLVASVNKSDEYFDYYSQFADTQIDAASGTETTFTLTGYQGMVSYLNPERVPLSGVAVKAYDKNGNTIDVGTTDKNGQVKASLQDVGEYILTAEGDVQGSAVTDINLMNYKTLDDTVDGTEFVKYDWTTYDTFYAYTEEDYGNGPYPADEIKYMEYEDWSELDDEEKAGYHWLYSNKLTASSPIIAPACIVDVQKPLDYVLSEIGKLSNDPRVFKAEDREKVEAIQAVYDALSAEDQKTVDTTFNHPSGDGQSYGRVLEAALWSVRSFDADTSTALADGTYDSTVVSSVSDKGKSDSSRTRNWWVESVSVENGKATAYIYATSGAATASKLTSYPSVWTGGKTIDRNADNNYPIPVDLNGTTYFGGVSSSMPRPIMYALDTTVTEPIPEKNITNNTGMFKAVSASYAMNADGSATLTVALSGSGYKELFKGNFEQAVANGDGTKDKGNDSWFHGYTNAAGKIEFQIPIAADEIGKPVPLVAVSNSYYNKYLEGQNDLARAFYPRQLALDPSVPALVTDDYDFYEPVAVTNNVSMFGVSSARIHTVGGPNSNGYKKDLEITMKNDSFGKVALSKARKADEEEQYAIENKVVVLPVEWNLMGGETQTSVLAGGDRVTTSWWSLKNSDWYERDMTLDTQNLTLVFDNTVKTSDIIDPYYDSTKTLDEMKTDLMTAITGGTLTVTPGLVDDMIENIYVQYRDEKTDFYCMATKVLWDALSPDDQEKVEEYDYFGRDTGDASEDNPLNQDEIGEKELLVVSFGTSFNDSRVKDIKAVEDALAKAYPGYAVRRAFTAQIIINHIQSRDNEQIDNMQQALDRAVANGVKELVVQPTHLMSGAEYDEMCGAIKSYSDKIEKIVICKPLLNSDQDKKTVAKAVVEAAVKDSKDYKSIEEMAADGTALVLMGHGTAHEASVTYTEMQGIFNQLGFNNVFVGTVEGIPASTSLPEVKKAIDAAGYTKVILRPLMVVAGDHANNDMAADEEGSWYYALVNGGEFEVEGADQPVDIGPGYGKDNVNCQIAGLGEIGIVQNLYVSHVVNEFKPATTNITMTFSNAGDIAMQRETVTVTDKNLDGKFDIDEAIIAFHDATYEGGAVEGYASNSGWITRFLGVDTGNVMFYVNNVSAMSTLDPIVEGDNLVLYTLVDTVYWTDAYSFFSADSYAAKANETVKVTLNKDFYDMNVGKNVIKPAPGATLTLYDSKEMPVDAKVYTVKDNKDGSYEVVVNKEGDFHLVASGKSGDNPLAAAVAELTIKGVSPKPAPTPVAPKVVKGKTYKVKGQYYGVTKVATAKAPGTVIFRKAKNAKNVTVPAAVKLADGKYYKVTQVGAKAFTGKKIRKVTIGKYVMKLTAKAFAGSKANKVVLKTKLLKKKTVKGSLKGSKVKVIQVKVGTKKTNKKVVKLYKKIFTKKNAGKKVLVI